MGLRGAHTPRARTLGAGGRCVTGSSRRGGKNARVDLYRREKAARDFTDRQKIDFANFGSAFFSLATIFDLEKLDFGQISSRGFSRGESQKFLALNFVEKFTRANL